MRQERLALIIVLLILVGLPAVTLAARAGLLAAPPAANERVIELMAAAPESGSWQPETVRVAAGERVRFRIHGADVMHGFAIGQTDVPSDTVEPGKVAEFVFTPPRPGRYTFYCTVWCSPNHWRMRGTLEVTGPDEGAAATPAPPLYQQLGLDIDAPHVAVNYPTEKPSAARGEALGLPLPDDLTGAEQLRRISPSAAFTRLRADPAYAQLTDDQLWDLLAFAWKQSTTPERLAEGQRTFAANCAACHGQTGRGDGPGGRTLVNADPMGMSKGPANFTDAQNMAGGSSAIYQGKILRGGMGTGMPYWGPILTEAQTWSVVDYLWTFLFEY
jgi:mono/diheme cytochrome c family protein/plastocyanin